MNWLIIQIFFVFAMVLHRKFGEIDIVTAIFLSGTLYSFGKLTEIKEGK